MERFFDVLFSSFALLLIFPIFVPLVIILKFTGEGEVLYLQERMGKDGKPFKLFKFATMLKNSPNLGTGTVTIKNDPRVLPIGNFLRKTKINELPQLINILIGNMSVIGPRPLTPETFNSYPHSTKVLIKQVSPGLSGVGSIIFRGEENLMHGKTSSIEFYKNVIAPYKGQLEEWFINNKSLYLYFLAILITLWVVLFPKSNVAWTVFKELPKPPEELKLALGYKE